MSEILNKKALVEVVAEKLEMTKKMQQLLLIQYLKKLQKHWQTAEKLIYLDSVNSK